MIVYKRVNRQEKSLRHIAMVAKFLDLNKLWSGTNGCTQEQNWRAYFSSIIHECNLPSRNIVTCTIQKFCYTSPLHWVIPIILLCTILFCLTNFCIEVEGCNSFMNSFGVVDMNHTINNTHSDVYLLKQNTDHTWASIDIINYSM